MAHLFRKLAAVGLMAAGLAACGGSNSSAPPAPVVVVPAAPRLEDQFGANFGTAYRADPNTDARDPVAGDIVPLSLTTEAVTI